MMEVILKRFDDPDEITHFEKGKFETVSLHFLGAGEYAK